jgi:hypothetical protein
LAAGQPSQGWGGHGAQRGSGFNGIVSGGIDEDEDEDDGGAVQLTAPHVERPAEDEEEESSERRRGKTEANEESWEAFKRLLVKEKISDRDTWRRWTKSNKKVIADHGWPVEGITNYWRSSGFPFTTFKAFSGNQDPSGNRRVGVSGDKMDSDYHVDHIEMKHIDDDEVPSNSPCLLLIPSYSSLHPLTQEAGAQVKKHKGSDCNDAGTCSSWSAGAQRGGGGGCGATGGGSCNDMADDWMVEGNEYVGRRVRRSLREDDKIVGGADGEIVGWLPAEKADYISDITHVPVALWHVLYDDEALGEEDLEEFEVREAIDSFERDEWAGMGEDDVEGGAAAGTCSSLSPGALKGSGGGCGGAAAHIDRSSPKGDRGETRGVASLGGGDVQVC